MKKIAAVFRVLSLGNFSHKQTGRFNRQLIDIPSLYEVRGKKVPGSSAVITHAPSTPFGTYTGPSPHPATGLLSSPVVFSLSGRKKRPFQKTIALVSLSPAPGDQPCTSTSLGLTYSIVMQVVGALEVNKCGPTIVAELVK